VVLQLEPDSTNEDLEKGVFPKAFLY
jgi:hypothetical protein